MQHRIVRPAILSIIGAYSPFYIAAVFLPFAPYSAPVGLLLATVFGFGGVVAGVWLSTISILLLLDHVRHRIWGSLAAISYAIAFPPLFYYSMALTGSQIGILTREGAWPAMIAPLVGLIGGVWGFFWRPSTIAVTPGTVTAKAPGLPRFPRDKPVMPALLSMAGTALPLFFLYIFVAALFAPPQPPPSGSEGPDFGFILLPILVGGAAFLVLLPIVFSIFLLFDPHRHRSWGMVLTVWWGLASVYLGVGLVESLFSPSRGIDPVFALGFTTLLGLAGGVWGIVWNTGTTSFEFLGRIVAPPGRVLIGGLVAFFSLLVLPVYFAFLGILYVVLVIGGGVLYATHTGSRVLSIVLMGVCVAVGFLLPWMVPDLGGYAVNQEFGFALVISIMLAGVGFAASGLVWSIRAPLITRWKNLKTWVVFVIVAGLLVGSIFTYSYIQAQSLPKPNVAITDIHGTYVEDCGASSSQTTTFNLTLTVVNTGGNGVATLGDYVNGQQVSSEGYYVAANSQLPIRHIFTVQACYGAQAPTYTVVLLSEQAA